MRGVHARHDDVQLGEELVGVVQRPVAEDVDLRAASSVKPESSVSASARTRSIWSRSRPASRPMPNPTDGEWSVMLM